MKKVLTLVLVLCLALTAAACGGGGGSAQPAESGGSDAPAVQRKTP